MDQLSPICGRKLKNRQKLSNNKAGYESAADSVYAIKKTPGLFRVPFIYFRGLTIFS